MVLYASYVCLMYSRFIENHPIDLEAMSPSFLRWFYHTTISVSHPVIVKVFPVLRVRVWKYFVFLSVEFVVQLSTRHISSSIGLT
jgi:hypothetical protein